MGDGERGDKGTIIERDVCPLDTLREERTTFTIINWLTSSW